MKRNDLFSQHVERTRDLADDLRLMAEWLDAVRTTTASERLSLVITPRQLTMARRRITLAANHLGIGGND